MHYNMYNIHIVLYVYFSSTEKQKTNWISAFPIVKRNKAKSQRRWTGPQRNERIDRNKIV